MVLFRNEGNTATLFTFSGKTKIVEKGSLNARFKVKIKRNPRRDSKDIIHKNGIDNRILPFSIRLSGAARFTDLAILEALVVAQTTIYLDTEGINDAWNGKYDFEGRWNPDIQEDWGWIKIKINLIENIN